MEFTAADIFQHSPFGDILKSVKSLSLSGEPWPGYGQEGLDADDEKIQHPPTTHFIATVDSLNDMLNFDSEDIDGMDDDVGEEQEPPPIGRRTATSSYDIYMVDTSKGSNGDEATEDNPLGRQAKHGLRRCRSKPHHSNTGTGDENNMDGAEDEYNPDQTAFE